MELIMDTTSMASAGKSLTSDAKDIENLINELFADLYAYQKSGSWYGVGADNFFANISKDQEKFLAVSDAIKSYGKLLTKSASSADAIIEKRKL